ncbi:hypothetical protein MHYP_G00154070 [Metynnis hypsauchen]
MPTLTSPHSCDSSTHLSPKTAELKGRITHPHSIKKNKRPEPARFYAYNSSGPDLSNRDASGFVTALAECGIERDKLLHTLPDGAMKHSLWELVQCGSMRKVTGSCWVPFSSSCRKAQRSPPSHAFLMRASHQTLTLDANAQPSC